MGPPTWQSGYWWWLITAVGDPNLYFFSLQQQPLKVESSNLYVTRSNTNHALWWYMTTVSRVRCPLHLSSKSHYNRQSKWRSILHTAIRHGLLCLEVCASNHEQYANLYCWVDETFYLPFEDPMPQRDEGRDRKITYYQWVPIILMLEACMFAAPYALWRVLSSRSGIDLAAIVEAASSSQQSAYAEQREKMHRLLCVQLSICFKTWLFDDAQPIRMWQFNAVLARSRTTK